MSNSEGGEEDEDEENSDVDSWWLASVVYI